MRKQLIGTDFYIEDTFTEYLHGLKNWDDTYQVSNPKFKTLILRHQKTKEFCGQAVLEFIKDSEGKASWLFLFAIHPDLRAKGLGSKLLHFAENYAKAHGSTEMFLSANKANEAFLIPYYQSKGYEKLYRDSNHDGEFVFSKKL